jgi:crossover junction endodeoxyribonuclease RuvC
MRVLGIDPGATGAAALFDPSKTVSSGLRWIVVDLPVVDGQLNAPELRDFIRKHAPDHCFTERLIGRVGWNASISFKLGRSYGSVAATVAVCDIPLTAVVPQKWKKHYGLIKTDKEQSRGRAIQLFPDQAPVLARKRDQNRAEAMLIAAYGAVVLQAF